jgi:hypothetical protein
MGQSPTNALLMCGLIKRRACGCRANPIPRAALIPVTRTRANRNYLSITYLGRQLRHHHRTSAKPRPRHPNIREWHRSDSRHHQHHSGRTDTIDYVATDQSGLTSTRTRTVIIEAPANDNQSTRTPANDNSPPPASAATSTATSTSS